MLVNNAGYRLRARLEDLPRAEWDAMVRTNLTGVFLFCQAAGRVMIRQRAGRIVNVTSVASRSGSRGMAAYAAAKAGVTTLTQSLGAEWAKYGITVNAVAPGPVETEGVLEAAPGTPGGDRLCRDLRRVRSIGIHDRRDRVRQRWAAHRQQRGLRTCPRD